MKGFYLAGDFSKGRKPTFMILSQSEKPFKIDSLRGIVEPRGISTMSKCRYFFASDWEFVEGWTITDLNKLDELRATIDEIWAGWCSKHHRKFSPILGKLSEVKK
jgi:hypothetical protein